MKNKNLILYRLCILYVLARWLEQEYQLFIHYFKKYANNIDKDILMDEEFFKDK